MGPLENLTVIEFCQYMSGPSAGLRLADLGARVIKIEKPKTGDAGRKLAVKDLFAGDNSVLFHTINRNKQSYVVDLKSPEGLRKIKKLLSKADVMIHNFRPGVMEKLTLGYESVKAVNPAIIYAVISGYGDQGPWKTKPGQDLLAQSISGLTWLSGNQSDPPVPFGLSIADYMSGSHLTQGILSALIQRNHTKQGALVEVNLLSSLIDFQFEVITTHLNDAGRAPQRAAKGNAHAYLGAPYGIYQTLDGYIVLAMEDLAYLAQIMNIPALLTSDKDAFTGRDQVMELLSNLLAGKSTAEWLSVFEPAGIWCAGVLNYHEFLNHEGFKVLKMDQEIDLPDGRTIKTTRCPVRIDGEIFFSAQPGPALGQDTSGIDQEFDLA